jgi:hypothetical protein
MVLVCTATALRFCIVRGTSGRRHDRTDAAVPRTRAGQHRIYGFRVHPSRTEELVVRSDNPFENIPIDSSYVVDDGEWLDGDHLRLLHNAALHGFPEQHHHKEQSRTRQGDAKLSKPCVRAP